MAREHDDQLIESVTVRRVRMREAACGGVLLIPGPPARVVGLLVAGGLLLYGVLMGAFGARPLGPALVLAGAAAALLQLPAVVRDRPLQVAALSSHGRNGRSRPVQFSSRRR